MLDEEERKNSEGNVQRSVKAQLRFYPRKIAGSIRATIEGEEFEAALSETARKKLQTPLESVSVEITRYWWIKVSAPSERDGLVGRVKLLDHKHTELEWESWPHQNVKEPIRQVTELYIEIDELRLLEDGSRRNDEPSAKRRKRESHSGDVIVALVKRVSPLMPTAVPFFFLQGEILSVTSSSSTITGTKQLFCFRDSHNASWHPLLRPGDRIRIENADFQEKFNLGTFEVPVWTVRNESRVSRYDDYNSKQDDPKPPNDEKKIEDMNTELVLERILHGNPSHPITFCGTITKRIGAFIIGIDGDPRLKVFFSHVPVAGCGVGLRIGAKVRFENVHLLFIRGQLEGFVFSMLSTYSIVKFGPELNEDDRFFRFSVEFQKLLGKADAITAFWLLEGLGRFSLKFGRGALGSMQQTSYVLKQLRQLRRILSPEEAEQQDSKMIERSLATEFLLENLILCPPQVFLASKDETLPISRRITAVRSKLPYIVTVEELNQRILETVKRATFTFGSSTSAICKQQVQGMDSAFIRIRSQDLFNHSEDIVIIGWVVHSMRTGQLQIRDKTGSIEVACMENCKLEKVLRESTSDRRLVSVCIHKFSITVETLGYREHFGQPNLLPSSSPQRFFVWASQFTLENDQTGCCLFRSYIDVDEQNGVAESFYPLEVFKPNSGATNGYKLDGSLIMTLLELPSIMVDTDDRKSARNPGCKLFGPIQFWHETLGKVQVVLDKDRLSFPSGLLFLSVGEVYSCFNLVEKSPERNQPPTFIFAHNSFFIKQGVEEIEHLQDNLLAGLNQIQHPAIPVNVSEVYLNPEKCLGSWKLRGIVTSFSMKERFGKAKNPIFPKVLQENAGAVELRDVNLAHSILCYIDPMDGRYFPPGALRVGSTVDISNPKRVETPQRGVYCQSAGTSSFRVVTLRPEGNEITVPSLGPLSQLVTLHSTMQQVLENPGKVFFSMIRFNIAEFQFISLSKRCSSCGREFPAGLSECTFSPCKRNVKFNVWCKLECVIEDGSAQGYVITQGEVVQTIFGSFWPKLCNLIVECPSNVLIYNMRKLKVPALDDLGFPLAASSEGNTDNRTWQEKFEDVVIEFHSNRFRMWTGLFKLHGNVRKGERKQDASVFQKDKVYMRDIHLSRDVVLPTGTLPRLTLVPLHLQEVDARTLILDFCR